MTIAGVITDAIPTMSCLGYWEMIRDIMMKGKLKNCWTRSRSGWSGWWGRGGRDPCILILKDAKLVKPVLKLTFDDLGPQSLIWKYQAEEHQVV